MASRLLPTTPVVNKPMRAVRWVLLLMCGVFVCAACSVDVEDKSHVAAAKLPSIWSHDNLYAWEVGPFDTVKRTPLERARMLKALGFHQYAHLPTMQPEELRTSAEEFERSVTQEIDALKNEGIELVAWYLWLEADHPDTDPRVKLLLDVFRRHNFCPQLWVSQSQASYPKTREQWQTYAPSGITLPAGAAEFAKLSDAQKQAVRDAYRQAWLAFNREDFPETPEAYERRVEREAQRIEALAKLAQPYGCKVNIYNHNGWLGMIENELAVLRLLEKREVTDVGLVYNFSHARDELHDDSKDFSRLWALIKPHVKAVNVTGMEMDDGIVIYPSEGDGELEMMRIIQSSGWRGPVGLLVQRPEDAEVALRNARTGLDWVAAELKKPGSGGPKPFTHQN